MSYIRVRPTGREPVISSGGGGWKPGVSGRGCDQSERREAVPAGGLRPRRSRGYTGTVGAPSMSSELDLIRKVYAYNSTVRSRYLSAIWKLPPRERHRDRGASYPSLVDIFMHVLDAYRFWFILVYARGPPFEEYPLGKKYGQAEAIREMRSVDRYIRRVLRDLTPRDLNRILPIPGRRRHKIEEELQHRGEMNALLWQARREPPVAGYGPR